MSGEASLPTFFLLFWSHININISLNTIKHVKNCLFWTLTTDTIFQVDIDDRYSISFKLISFVRCVLLALNPYIYFISFSVLNFELFKRIFCISCPFGCVRQFREHRFKECPALFDVVGIALTPSLFLSISSLLVTGRGFVYININGKGAGANFNDNKKFSILYLFLFCAPVVQRMQGPDSYS